jgi:hypothetical protein
MKHVLMISMIALNPGFMVIFAASFEAWRAQR